MPVGIGKDAIALAADNCRKRGLPVLSLGFHGGGEPTEAWDELVKLVEFARETCRTMNLKLELGVATNGCLSDEKADWLVGNASSINVSLDGPPDIQQKNRPMRDGNDSTGRILRFLGKLERAGVHYGLQATVTSEAIHRMPEIVHFVAANTRSTLLKFEPACTCGRFTGHDAEVPGQEDFARGFNKAFDEGVRLGIRVIFSGVRPHAGVQTTFCGAFCEPFAVTPEGRVSACFEVYDTRSPYAETFLIGHYNGENRSFVIDPEKMERLRARTVFNMPACQHCFCKYMCAGDCATRSFRFHGRHDLHAAGGRCETIRNIARHQLGYLVSQQLKLNQNLVSMEK